MAFGRELVMKGLIEALAAFIIVHTYCDASAADPFGRALTIGLSYMLIIGGLRTYANPAIHFGKAFGGTLGWVDAFWFFLCQIGGAFGGTVMNNIMFNTTPNIFGDSAAITHTFTLVYFEGLYATVICLITLRADDNSTEKDEAKDQATAIAAAYAVGNFIFGAKTGGIFNPAVAFGNALGTWSRCGGFNYDGAVAAASAARAAGASAGVADFLYPGCADSGLMMLNPDPNVQAASPGTMMAVRMGIKYYDFLWVHILAPYAGAFFSAVILWLGSDKYGIFWDKKGVDIDA